MIYRIAEPGDWQRALATGRFDAADLAAEGFLHASELDQVAATANRHYRGREDLVLLEIDEAKLAAPPVREDLTGRGVLYPHVYQAIPLAAIVRHVAFRPAADGTFTLPEALAKSSPPGD